MVAPFLSPANRENSPSSLSTCPPPPKPPPKPNFPMPNQYDYKKFAILYVDDEEKSLVNFTRAFGDDFRILTASNAQAGLQLIELHGEDIALLMTDQRMPGKKGVWLLERARQLRPQQRCDLQIRHQAVGPGATRTHAAAGPGIFHGAERTRPVAPRKNVRAAQYDDRRPHRQPRPARRRLESSYPQFDGRGENVSRTCAPEDGRGKNERRRPARP